MIDYTPWGTAYINEWLFPRRLRREGVQITLGEHSHRDPPSLNEGRTKVARARHRLPRRFGVAGACR